MYLSIVNIYTIFVYEKRSSVPNSTKQNQANKKTQQQQQTNAQTNKQTKKNWILKAFQKTLNLNSCYNKHFVAFDSCTFPEKEN